MKQTIFTIFSTEILLFLFSCGPAQKNVESAEDADEDNVFAEADALYDEAMRIESEGNSEEALQYYLGAVEEYNKIGVNDYENWGYAHYYIGLIYREMDEPAVSAEHFGKSYAVLEKALGPDDPQVAQILTYKGVMEKDAGKIEEAIKSFNKALKIREQEDPPDENQIRILKMNINDIREGW